MNNLAKIVIAVSVPAVLGFVGFVWYAGVQEATIDRFPEIDTKIARKAYNEMMKSISTGQYGPDMADYSIEQMDQIFFAEVDILTANQ